MNSSQEAVGSYRRLKAELGTLLEGQNARLTLSEGSDYPLLVLETDYDTVGFAVVDGRPEPAYLSAYDAWKQLYRERHVAWKERNLSFVVCRSEPTAEHDAFFSSVATDAYFCRKYVIWLGGNRDELEQELLRLPFLPLPEGHKGGIMRPPSAQTLLQNLGVSAQLARQIIVPMECSPDRLIDDLLKMRESLPDIGGSAGADVKSQQPPAERTRIKRVEIEAFRAYGKRQEFDVDADVVVLYGPNGLGKTSFFDALDYVCTGRIGRLCRRRISPKEFAELARHLASAAGEGYVAMDISRGSKTYSMRREVGNWSTALRGTERLNRASALQFLATADWGPRKERIENLERLFRATHLFGQSDTELLVGFEEDSTLASDLVTRMIALEDYASGMAKAAAVLGQLDRLVAVAQREIDRVTDDATETHAQIRALAIPLDSAEPGVQLSDMAAQLAKDLQVVAGVKIADGPFNEAVAREWRAVSESALADAQDRLRRLQNALSGFGQYEEATAALNGTAAELAGCEGLLRDKTAEHERRREEARELTNILEKEQAALRHITSRLRALARLDELLEAYSKSDSSLQKWRRQSQGIAGEVDTITGELHQLLAIRGGKRTEREQTRAEVQGKSQHVQALATIQNSLPLYEQNRASMANLEHVGERLKSAIRDAEVAVGEKEACLATKKRDLAACERVYGELTANQISLTQLLDEVEGYVDSGICPTCGTDYLSREALIGRIRAQKLARPAQVEEVARRCTDLRSTVKQVSEARAALAVEHASKHGDLEQVGTKIKDLQEAAEAFERAVADACLTLDQHLATTVGRTLVEESAALRALRETLRKIEAELTNTSKRIEDLEQKRSQLAEIQKAADAAMLTLEQQITDIRAEADASGLSLEMPPDERAAQRAELTSRKAAVEDRIRKLTPQIEAMAIATSELNGQIDGVREAIKRLRQDKARLELAVQSYEEDATYLIGRVALTLSTISEQKGLAADRVNSLQTIRGRCIALEQTVDAAQRSGRLADLQVRAELLASQREMLIEETSRKSKIRTWFSSVRDVLDRQSSTAIADHVNAFGPLASVIQKRLRSVYGFGDVSLLPKGNEIRVEVAWQSKRLKPVDYFSDSQKQILMLSLFLASRLTQTWSGFAPILMDDPVTHFDDLNAFGFVELIRGIVCTSPGKRQFFISTCEDRLFDLMRRKFADVQREARFYKFEAVGCDGPVVRQL